MILDVTHKTLYRYSSPVVQSQHLVHMSPRPAVRQTVIHHSLMIEPAPATRYDGVDAFGNSAIILDIEVPHREFSLCARSTIATEMPEPLDYLTSAAWDSIDDSMRTKDNLIDLDVVQYRCTSRATTASPEIAAYAQASFAINRPLLDGAMNLVNRIYDDFKFDSKATDISTPVTEVFRLRRGVCQDFAHLTLACLRALRIPSRYVSGYILTRPSPGQAKLLGADASHAWISVWSPESGWIDFDPTNGIAVKDEHVTIAHGRDYDDVSPISGVLLGGGDHAVSVGVDVVQVG